MNTKKDEALCNKYPNLYRNRNKSPQTTCMSWGFSCGDGWYDLIDELSAKLETEIVKLLLANSKGRVDLRSKDNYVIKWASRNGHTEIVRLLLADPRVDPSVKNSIAIKWAAQNGHTEVVRLLSVHPKLAYTKQLNTEILTMIVKAWLSLTTTN